jgi:hypothetical protein
MVGAAARMAVGALEAIARGEVDYKPLQDVLGEPKPVTHTRVG